MTELVLATGNPGKIKELKGPLERLDIRLRSLGEFSLPPIDESGSTFEENAILKASTVAEATGLWAIGEDSGLVVDALGGAPGVHSARYAGNNADDASNVQKLLKAMADVPKEMRQARFMTVMALASPGGTIRTTEGTCEGHIGFEPQGQGGFGYDPVFIPSGETRTFGQMSLEEKALFSHREKALKSMLVIIKELVRSGQKTGRA